MRSLHYSREATLMKDDLDQLVDQAITSLKRALVTADPAELDRAIAIFRRAAPIKPAGHPDRLMCLSNLSTALTARFERQGRLADLHEAIDAGRSAVDAAVINDPNYAIYAANLATALRTRFQRLGHVADLDEAVRRAGAAIDATPLDHRRRAAELNTCATVTCRRPAAKRVDLLRSLTAGYDIGLSLGPASGGTVACSARPMLCIASPGPIPEQEQLSMSGPHPAVDRTRRWRTRRLGHWRA
jgi:hypothetical protein